MSQIKKIYFFCTLMLIITGHSYAQNNSLYTLKKNDNHLAILFENLHLWVTHADQHASDLKKNFNIVISDDPKVIRKNKNLVILPKKVKILEYWFTKCDLNGNKIFHASELSKIPEEQKKVCSGITIEYDYLNEFLAALMFSLRPNVAVAGEQISLISGPNFFSENLWQLESLAPDRINQQYYIYRWNGSYFFINVVIPPRA